MVSKQRTIYSDKKALFSPELCANSYTSASVLMYSLFQQIGTDSRSEPQKLSANKLTDTRTIVTKKRV
ncbi:MAG: hypothetical protein ACD_21C00242G0007 [uncultured bacterium]|nr:MAG: hypothetical protein ACD_21C00242G0007 [uncultured bacterium]